MYRWAKKQHDTVKVRHITKKIADIVQPLWFTYYIFKISSSINNYLFRVTIIYL